MLHFIKDHLNDELSILPSCSSILISFAVVHYDVFFHNQEDSTHTFHKRNTKTDRDPAVPLIEWINGMMSHAPVSNLTTDWISGESLIRLFRALLPDASIDAGSDDVVDLALEILGRFGACIYIKLLK